MNILIVGGEPALCRTLAEYISIATEHRPEILTDSRKVISFMERNRTDLVISDICMPGLSGIRLAERICRKGFSTEIILISGEEDMINSIHAFDMGVFDFLTKPVDMTRLSSLLAEVEIELRSDRTDFLQYLGMERIPLADIVPPDIPFFQIGEHGRFIAHSEKMRSLRKKAEKIALFADMPVLITGKPGSGKELIARMIHAQSCPDKAPFIVMKCAGMDKNLFERELFGYGGGTYTEADRKGTPGKFALAAGGTLFLDEIAEIPPDILTKLLRVLQEREYFPVGGAVPWRVNARIVCAANSDILKPIEKDAFREDLFCRFNVPGLDERREDILPLSLYFLGDISGRNDLSVTAVTGGFLGRLTERDWPGNVRQLRNTIMQALLFCDRSVLDEGDIKVAPAGGLSEVRCFDPENIELPDTPFSLNALIERIILKSLEKFRGNKTKAARFLGLDRYQFYRRYRKVTERFRK